MKGEVVYDGRDCVITIRRAAPAVVLITFTGTDVGEFGPAPFLELEKDLSAAESVELFIDARGARGASLDVSGGWASWLKANKPVLRRVSMLTGSPFIQLSAGFVKKFADLGEAMRLYSDAAAFERDLARATRGPAA